MLHTIRLLTFAYRSPYAEPIPTAVPSFHRRRTSILVPLDGTAFAEHALPYALALARRAGAELRLVHVHSPLEAFRDPGLLAYEGGLNARCRDRQMAYLQDAARRVARACAVRTTPVMIEGWQIARALRAVANETADLMIVATHARGPLARLVHGSIAAQLIHGLAVPLLLVPGRKTPPELAADPPLRHFERAWTGCTESLDPCMLRPVRPGTALARLRSEKVPVFVRRPQP